MKRIYLHSCIFIQLISISFLFGNADLVSYNTEAPLIDHLNSINNEWNKQKDIPTDLLTIHIKFNTDEERIQLHLKLVESILGKRSNDHLTVQQFVNRKKNLQSLMSYWKEGQFPTNTRHSHRQPYFIDDFGTACAVGHLLLTSGEEDLAHHVSDVQNYAYIHEMNYPQLNEWASENGFTKDELAWIQPTYGEHFCYYANEISGQEYSDTNQPLSQQEIKTMAYIPGEGMIYGGNFSRYDAATGTQTTAVFGDSNYGNSIQGTVYDIEYYNGLMYVAGDFVLAGTNFYNIAYWNGTDWVGIQTGDMGGIIRDMVVYDCRLYVGGDFTAVDGNSTANLVVWNGTTWSTTPQDCAGQSATQTLQVNGAVNTFEVYQDKLAIGGDFTQVMGNANMVEGLIFWNDLTVEFLSTHGSISSINNLESYESLLMVGEDSLCAYREGQWYYPGSSVHLPELNLPFGNTHVWIPRITDIHDIFYIPSNDNGFALGFGHLMISTNNEVWAINDSPIDISAPYVYSNYRITLDGTVSTIWGDGYTTIYGGNFNTIDIYDFYVEDSDCEYSYEANKLFSLNREFFLPIELAEFTVKSSNNKTAQLKWTSLTETNSLHYEVERKTDNEDFTRVGAVAAAGESIDKIDYTFEDDISKISGKYVYYRLKMVDKDGSFEYSEVRSLKLKTNVTEIAVYPNPTKNIVELSMEMQAGGDVNVYIYDMQGRQLSEHQWIYESNSIVRERIDVSHLETGLYLVEVVSPHERKTIKLDVLK